MKILVTGATGFVGSRLVKSLKSGGHQIVVLSRNPEQAKAKLGDVEAYAWTNVDELPPKEAVLGIDAVINLMGENISAKRWSEEQKKELTRSRVTATENLIDRIKSESVQLKAFISTSAIGFYPINQDSKLDESGSRGNTFLADLCEKWEAAAKKISDATERLVIIRVGVVLGEEGGALSKLLPIFKLGLGGPVGAGEQVMSWIHVDDLVNLYQKALEDDSYKGIINGVAPDPVSNKIFSKSLAKALGRPAIFPAPPFALKLAMGEMSTIVLDSQEIVSKTLTDQNFEFLYPKIDQAMQEIAR